MGVFRGVIAEISDKIVMKRNIKQRKDINKVTLTINMLGDERVYADLIDKNIALIKSENLEVNTVVEVNFSFKGTNSTDKKYNNIFVNSIKNLKI